MDYLEGEVDDDTQKVFDVCNTYLRATIALSKSPDDIVLQAQAQKAGADWDKLEGRKQ